MEKHAKIFVAGHKGMVGSAILRKLTSEGYTNLVLRPFSKLDLRDQNSVEKFFTEEQPEYVFLAAAQVGGIYANSHFGADFIYNNLLIQSNVIHQSFKCGVKKLLFLGSSCIYPKFAEQPIKESSLLSGLLEPTNEPYAIAKIAGIKMCQAYRKQYGSNFISVMPTNLYGPNDRYDLLNSHVLPAMIVKFFQAKWAGSEAVEIWGTGSPRREFLHVDDLAEACVFLMNHYNEDEIINVGCGKDITIRELAMMVRECVDFKGHIYFNTDRPDGTPRKLLDITKIKSLGWAPQIDLASGIKQVCSAFEKEYNQVERKVA